MTWFPLSTDLVDLERGMSFSTLSLQNFLFFFFFFAVSFWWPEFRPVCGHYFTLSAENHFWCPCGKQCAEQAGSLQGCSHQVGFLSSPWSSVPWGHCPPAPWIPCEMIHAWHPDTINKPEFLLDPSLFVCIVGTEVRDCAKLYSWEQKVSSALHTHLNKRVFRTWGILTQSWEYCFHACVMQVTELKKN